METVINDIEKVKLKVDEYKMALNKIAEKRLLWTNAVKNKIFEVLLEIKKSEQLDWRVQKIEAIKNLEAVNIIFNKSHSGIVENNTHSYIKHGGGIVFSQAYNGDIFVIIMYPFVEDCVGQLENKLIDKINPNDITESYIIFQVVKFLDEMIIWESSNTKTDIGFKIEK